MRRRFSLFMSICLLIQMFFPGLSVLAASAEKINHTIKTNETANMCLREHEGKLKFQWPFNKKKIDLVIVQDASGSFRDSISDVKKTLQQSVGQLNPAVDRVMVTSFQGQKGYKTIDGKVLYDYGTNVKTTLQTGLNEGLASAKKGIDNIKLDGATPSASGLQFALQQYEKAKGAYDPDRQTVFLFVTDGVPNARLDGYVYKKSNQISDPTVGNRTSVEYQQDYKGAMDEVTNIANQIKDKGYKLVTAFWENKKYLSTPENYYDKYDKEVGPYSRNALQKMATKPEWFVLSNDINEFTKNLVDTLSMTNKNEKDRMVLDFYNDLEIEDIRVKGPNGFSTKPVLKNNQLVWDLEGQPEGEYNLYYKVIETKPNANSFDIAGGLITSYDAKFEIPITHTPSNPNAIKCIPGKIGAAKLADKKVVQPGEKVTYTIVARNVVDKTT
uniref:vWA domain-containing protein n=1 Tax=Bacillus cereus group sp. BfR-BA-01309 TaxID=2920286 RepID=UPI001F57A424